MFYLLSNYFITCKSKTFDLPQWSLTLEREKQGVLRVEGRAGSGAVD